MYISHFLKDSTFWIYWGPLWPNFQNKPKKTLSSAYNHKEAPYLQVIKSSDFDHQSLIYIFLKYTSQHADTYLN